MKVVLATDGSAHSALARVLIEKMPVLRGAHVVVASAVAPIHLPLAGIEPFGSAALGEVGLNAFEQARESARATVDSTAEKLSERGFRAEGVVLDGEAGTVLLDFAERESADVLAIGSRGLGGIKSLFLGSVARRLVTHCKSSVLVAHAYKGLSVEDSIERLSAREKLAVEVGIDGSSGAQAALEWVQRAGPDGYATLLAVCAEPLSVVPAGVDPTTLGEFYKYDHERVEAVAKSGCEACKGLAPDLRWITNLGRPVDVLSEAAASYDIDLIVVGATRHSTLERFLIGSVSYETVVRASCSVLVVRPDSI